MYATITLIGPNTESSAKWRWASSPRAPSAYKSTILTTKILSSKTQLPCSVTSSKVNPPACCSQVRPTQPYPTQSRKKFIQIIHEIGLLKSLLRVHLSNQSYCLNYSRNPSSTRSRFNSALTYWTMSSTSEPRPIRYLAIPTDQKQLFYFVIIIFFPFRCVSS